ncbi:ATPase [Marinobacterium nitratireducens]|uniref:ATPase n=1 Tax=Marinobacterium nitratireducens TaxID=518897 RepID=A0A918DQ36_9GAMM|nr:cupredoxin domain-containing protein [Marinobacterium nitratireducens]GGO76606.1 ATPase [Marinobacterium nitratireducens]
MSILVNIVGLGLIALIVWWFWLYRPTAAAQSNSGAVSITVDDGVYSPSRVSVKSNQPVVLRFMRKDPSPCAAMVIFDDLNISEELPVGKPKEISLKVEKPGTYAFTCQMKMYRGELVVEG